jgi:hypothetical protein
LGRCFFYPHLSLKKLLSEEEFGVEEKKVRMHAVGVLAGENPHGQAVFN